jgi:S-adenosylmethionine:tRNA ribosyltransferase-isomerase
MHRRDFYYDLPETLIAQHPPACRSDGRLLVLDGARAAPGDAHMRALPEFLHPGDLLVLNDTRVIPARLLGLKDSGGRVELLVERLLDEGRALVQIRASKPPRPGARIHLAPGAVVRIEGRRDDMYVIACDGTVTLERILRDFGQVPLPPYITRRAETADTDRYQTLFARHTGSVAAPTAGLHFDEPLLAALHARGVEFGFVTLHVGAGTFQPLRCERVADHVMHPERVAVSTGLCAQVVAARARGGRVIAVGTTSVRALETAAQAGEVRPYTGDTRLFIYPGYTFKCVDAIITNFHLPESTLLMLVCAFAGRERVMDAYAYAIERRYRFLSYGDAMLIVPRQD